MSEMIGWTAEEEEEQAVREQLFDEELKLLYETDVTFERAVELIKSLQRNSHFGYRRRTLCEYGDGWRCNYGEDKEGIMEIQFTRAQPAVPPAQGVLYMFARPNDLPAVLCRDGMCYWYDASASRDTWKSSQLRGAHGEICDCLCGDVCDCS